MSVASAPTDGSPGAAAEGTQQHQQPAPPVDAACPLCGATLERDQEWCVRCGAAARTRLAAPTNWKAPILALALIVTLALGALAASLVKLTGSSSTSSTAAPVTRTITTVTPTVGAPGVTGATTTPPAGGGGVSVPTSPGAVNPGTPTTLTPTSSQGASPGAASTGSGAGGTTSPTATQRSPQATEEALRKAGILPRAGR